MQKTCLFRWFLSASLHSLHRPDADAVFYCMTHLTCNKHLCPCNNFDTRRHVFILERLNILYAFFCASAGQSSHSSVFFCQPINTSLTFHPEKKTSHTLGGNSLHYPFSVLIILAQQGEQTAVLLGGSLMLLLEVCIKCSFLLHHNWRAEWMNCGVHLSALPSHHFYFVIYMSLYFFCSIISHCFSLFSVRSPTCGSPHLLPPATFSFLGWLHCLFHLVTVMNFSS